MRKLQNILNRFAYNPSDSTETRFSKNLILIVAVSCSLCGIMWGYLYYMFLGVGLTMILPLVFVAIVGCTIPLSHWKRDHTPLIYAQLICITWITAGIQWSLGSMNDSGIVIAWSFLGPVGALLFLKRTQAYLWIAMFILIVLISVLLEPKLSNDAVNMTEMARKIFYIMNLCFPASVVFTASLYFVTNLTEQKNLNFSLLQIKEQKNKEILDSITYAKRIQYALLANKNLLENNLFDYFVLFKPKDIVSGDFYWATKRENKFYLAVCDSTGHGVPGAFMSLLNISFLNEAVNEKNIVEPHFILNHVRKKLIENIDGGQDGMDAILMCFDENKITYSAANNSPVLIKNGELISMPSNKMPVGNGEKTESFSLHTIEFQKGDSLYLYTDGYSDQFGGSKGKKFKHKQLKELITSITNLPLTEQSEILNQKFGNWKGNLEQVDDILVIGIRL